MEGAYAGLVMKSGMEIGMRRGKRRAIHLPGELRISRDGGASIQKLFGLGELARIAKYAERQAGRVWLAIAPATERFGMRLAVLQQGGSGLKAVFEGGHLGRVEIILDDRGRAKNLTVGAEYSIAILPNKAFFEMYERRSIPTGGGGRSEPQGLGEARLRNFEDLMKGRVGMALDVATGIKVYLKTLLESCAVTCGNISPSMLKRTKEWLGDKNASFVAYDAEIGFPFKNREFDLAICDAFLEYVKDPIRVLKEMAGLLREGGELFLLEPVKALTSVEEFYPQDLWELALWRPIHDEGFKGEIIENELRRLGFEALERRTMEFEYPIYGVEKFRQEVVRFVKTTNKVINKVR